MKIHGFDARHFLNSAFAHIDESGDPDLCPDQETRRHYQAVAQVDALIGLALVIATAAEVESPDSLDAVLEGLDHDGVAPVLDLPIHTDKRKAPADAPAEADQHDPTTHQGEES